MAGPNIDPIVSRVGDLSTNGTTGMSQFLLTADNDYTGIGANAVLVFTADATNGGYVQRLRFKAAGTNTASVARIFINNGLSPGTATNNCFYGEVSLPATTGIATSATVEIDYPMEFALPAGFRIYFNLGTTVAAGWNCVAIGGKY